MNRPVLFSKGCSPTPETCSQTAALQSPPRTNQQAAEVTLGARIGPGGVRGWMEVVRTANHFESAISIYIPDRAESADASQFIELTSLMVTVGQTVLVTAVGRDCVDAVQAVSSLLASNEEMQPASRAA